jgi:hypothetical protein
MFKIIGLVFLAAAGFTWLRQYWANNKNANTSKNLIDGLKSRKYAIADLSETLGMNIRVKPLDPGSDPESMKRRIATLPGKKLLDKFQIQYADADQEARAVVIAEAIIKDIVPLYDSNKEVDVLYPCWIYIECITGENQVYFKSSMPSDKDHQFLLEDFADELYVQLFG